jgi:hypothetical protein
VLRPVSLSAPNASRVTRHPNRRHPNRVTRHPNTPPPLGALEEADQAPWRPQLGLLCSLAWGLPLRRHAPLHVWRRSPATPTGAEQVAAAATAHPRCQLPTAPAPQSAGTMNQDLQAASRRGKAAEVRHVLPRACYCGKVPPRGANRGAAQQRVWAAARTDTASPRKQAAPAPNPKRQPLAPLARHGPPPRAGTHARVLPRDPVK